MTDALCVKDLNKAFKEFSLRNVSFSVLQGQVVGLIGENGSGKSTTIRCILGQDIPTSGTITIYGKNAFGDAKLHNAVGTAFEGAPFPENFDARQLSSVFEDVFDSWKKEAFFGFLKRFDVPLDRQVRHLSKGMKAKLGLAVALSHDAKLLLLDEATAGLDPVVRDDILDLLQEFMEDESHAILMTSHITSDLERIADRILYIRNGEILFEIDRDALDRSGLARLRKEDMELLDLALVMARKTNALNVEILIRDRDEFMRRYPDFAIDPVTLDEIIVMFSKGEQA